MSLPPYRAYAVLALLAGTAAGAAAWFLWRSFRIAAVVDLVATFSALVLVVALSKTPPEPGRRPGDPGR